MPGLRKNSKTDWGQVQRDVATDAPVVYDPDTDLYDPNDPEQVQNFFTSAKVVRKPGRPKAETTKIPTAIRLSADVVAYFKSTGSGWQSRIDAALRDWMAEHPLPSIDAGRFRRQHIKPHATRFHQLNRSLSIPPMQKR